MDLNPGGGSVGGYGGSARGSPYKNPMFEGLKDAPVDSGGSEAATYTSQGCLV